MRESPTGKAATISMLKALIDSGDDLIDVYLPFVLGAIQSIDGTSAKLREVADRLSVVYQLQIPETPLSTILNRARKRGFVHREGGLFHKTPALEEYMPPAVGKESPGLSDLLDGLCSHLREYGEEVGRDDATGLLFEFLDRAHVAMLLSDEQVREQDLASEAGEKTLRLIAKFLIDDIEGSKRHVDAVHALISGLVLAKALLLEDLSSVSKKLAKCAVYLDSLVVLRALGWFGEAEKRSVCGLLGLIREAGGALRVYSETVKEIVRILRFYEMHLGTKADRYAMRRTPITTHVLEMGYSSSDITEKIGLLPMEISGLGIAQTGFRSFDPSLPYNMDEFAERISRTKSDLTEPRVEHDRDCVASVLTEWGNLRPGAVADAPALFVTATWELLETTREWYREYSSGQGPVIYYQRLANVLWLSNPRLAYDGKMAELAGQCQALLAPRPHVWKAFLGHLRGLEQKGILADEEGLELVSESLLDRLLGEAVLHLAPGEPLDAESALEVIERVRSERDRAYRTQLASLEEQVEASAATLERTEAGVHQIAARDARLILGAGSALVAGLGILVLVRGSVALGITLIVVDCLASLLGWSRGRILGGLERWRHGALRKRLL